MNDADNQGVHELCGLESGTNRVLHAGIEFSLCLFAPLNKEGRGRNIKSPPLFAVRERRESRTRSRKREFVIVRAQLCTSAERESEFN